MIDTILTWGIVIAVVGFHVLGALWWLCVGIGAMSITNKICKKL